MGMASVLMYNVVELTKKYIDHPISVQLNVDHQPQLTFPAVTVCNMNPVKRSAWMNAQHAVVKSRRKRAAGTCVVRLVCAAITYLSPGRPKNGPIQCEPKNQDTLLVSITSRNIKRFSKFFHCWTQHKICYKMIITYPTF